jgi:hypothetical protein
LKGGLKYLSLCEVNVLLKKIILEFSFAIPGTSAAIERVSAIKNVLLTDEKSHFLVETIKTVIVTNTRFEELSCNDFYILISSNPKLLQEIHSSMMYRTSVKRKEQLLQHYLEINFK